MARRKPVRWEILVARGAGVGGVAGKRGNRTGNKVGETNCLDQGWGQQNPNCTLGIFISVEV